MQIVPQPTKGGGILFLQLTMARLAQEFARAPIND